jgi:hypothetical protein
MMKQALVALATSAAIVVPTAVVTAAPAAAGYTPGCVDRAEFRKVKDGMTKAKVHEIFDTRGKRMSIGSGGESREYRTCSGDSWSYVSVDYERNRGAWRVWFKWQYISY